MPYDNNKKTIKGYRQTRPSDLEETGKVQPQVIKMEEAVLGALMIEQNAYDSVNEIISANSFYKHAHQIIFQAIVDLNLKNLPVDILTVTETLRSQGQLEAIGGPVYLAEISSRVGTTAHLGYHAQIIAQKYLARQLITFSSEVQNEAFDESLDVNDLMQDAESKLFKISQKNLKKDYTHIDPVIKDALEQIKVAAAREDGLSGLASGYHKLDKMTSGWQNSDLIIIAARPAMGKTAFVLSMIRNMAVDAKIPVAMFSLEMSNVQLVNRLIINVSEIRGETIKNGQLKSYEWTQLDQRVNLLFGAPIYIDDTPSLSVFELRTKARRLVKEHQIKIIVIDYLQLMNASGMKHGSRQEEVSTISRSLKALAKELNIPIIALSQLNRGVEAREGNAGKRPQLSDLRESGAIEQDADMVCFIHRPEYYKIVEEDGKDYRGMAEIIIAKHRSGGVGDITLRFRKEFAKFENVEDGSLDSLTSGVMSSSINNEQNEMENISLHNDNRNIPPAPMAGGFDTSQVPDADNNMPF
ncbi:MAG: replicative DNA helicase [Bacteroidaceae bacterium]